MNLKSNKIAINAIKNFKLTKKPLKISRIQASKHKSNVMVTPTTFVVELQSAFTFYFFTIFTFSGYTKAFSLLIVMCIFPRKHGTFYTFTYITISSSSRKYTLKVKKDSILNFTWKETIFARSLYKIRSIAIYTEGRFIL